MGEINRAPAQRMEDRSPYDVATAAVRVIVRWSDFSDADAVMEALVEARGPSYRDYLTTIAQARHSIFYYQLQDLYEFGQGVVRPDVRDDFCRLVGREFAESMLAVNYHPLQQVALADEGGFQDRVAEIIREYLVRFTEDRYELTVEFDPEEIRLTVTYRAPELVKLYLEQYGLDPQRCLRNSLTTFGSAIEYFVTTLVADRETTRFKIDLGPDGAVFHLPVRATDRFNYQNLIGSLIGHVRDLEVRKSEAIEEHQLQDILILGSEVMRDKWRRIQRASKSDELILLRGESGTGKSFMARKIHELSSRSSQPFIEVALTSDVGSDNMIQSDLFGHEKDAFTGATKQKQGLFSLADGGTIFLDEIGDATPELQAKLLRVLENSTFRRLGGTEDIQVDVRVIAATNRDLEEMIEDGSFRRDLYFRLNVIPLELPSLRERPEDIPPLAQFLLARAQGKRHGPRVELSAKLAQRLAEFPWPGNIRELDHALRHALALAEGREIQVSDLPPTVATCIEGGPSHMDGGAAPGPAPPPAAERSPGRQREEAEIIDREALRRMVHSTNPVTSGTSNRTETLPAHVDYARRVWLEVLIEELDGDLALIGQFWDRGSEKTLRNVIRGFGLSQKLAEARARKSRARK